MNGNIVLIGFMGSGKTTVGDAIAKAAGMPHMDTDTIIEQSAGMPIPEIFHIRGEKGFRHLETRTLTILSDTEVEPTVYSTGGGIVMQEINRPLLRRLGKVVWLRIQPETVLARIGDDDSRPMLAAPDKEQRVRDLLDLRHDAYESCAELIVDVDDKTPEEIAQEILTNI